MATQKPPSDTSSSAVPEPRGFGEHVRGLAGEYAHEQGWGLNQEERMASPKGKQPTDGGNDYSYGAQDFGDTPVDTSAARPTREDVDTILKD